MRVDIVTIFPDFFRVLDISLLGRARADGLLDVRVHDLRDATSDRHRTVDDTPYGGGAGMVMKPEPWGVTLDRLRGESPVASPLVVFPSPAGVPFTQQHARRLAAEEHIIFGCGRYEGIDERVFQDTARGARVELISLGDYVLNGGEVAVTAMIEAFARLVPGVIGNPGSLDEESHADGLLEYPIYTKPASWRGLDVPEVLLSGHHERIAQWRREQQIERTRRTRPELLPQGTQAELPAPAGSTRRAARAERAARVLVTGFEPFAGASRNASWEAVSALAEAGMPGAELEILRLPVAFGAAGERLREEFERVRPDLVLATGLDASARGIRLERLAVNLDDARIPDNAGAQPVDAPAVPGAPLARAATLPVKACLAALREAGLPAELSMSAGGFVCNHLFVHLMDALEGARRADGAPVRGGFVHVPEETVLPVAETTRGLRAIIATSLATAEDAVIPAGELA